QAGTLANLFLQFLQKIIENMTRLVNSDEEDQLQDLHDACNLTPPPS
ncbi:5814_t:CDS:2, partial [Diversispora eburnea]